MEQKSVQAQFQLLDSFVKEFNINTLKKIDKKDNINITGQLGFKIDHIEEDVNTFVGQIELINDLKLALMEEEYANIHISMIGIFSCTKTKDYDKDRFEEMLKINGATTLSHLIRAYIYTVTGLSGIPQISTPMINFLEFFENAKEFNNDNNREQKNS